MASHADSDHKPEGMFTPQSIEETMKAQAEALTREKGNVFTAGDLHGEKVLKEEKVGMFLVRQLPDDPIALRVSIGEGQLAPGDTGYLVFRGRANDITELLERALSALKASHFEW